eukprot:43818-Eustigmatos_ZCMA.PRE.1
MDCTPLRAHVYGEPTWGRVRLCGHDPPTIGEHSPMNDPHARLQPQQHFHNHPKHASSLRRDRERNTCGLNSL